MASFNELVKEYWTLSASGHDKTTIAKLKKVKELLGEEGARLAALSKYGSAIRTPIVVPRRGAKGASILDMLFELEDGRFVLVESKYGTAQLGRVQDRHVKMVSPSGKVTPLPLTRQVEQLSPLWVKDRIKEIARQDEALALRLELAVEKGELHILEIRTRLEPDGTLASEITDRTEEFKNWRGRRHTDPERQFARREALAARAERATTIEAKEARDAADKAKRKADTAQRQADTAKRNFEKDPGVRESTKQKRQAAVAEKQKLADDLKAKAVAAEADAKRAEGLRDLSAKLTENERQAREAEETRKRLERARATAEAEKSAATAATRAGEAARADTAIAGKMIENRGRGGTAVAEKAVFRDAAPKAGEIVKAIPKRAVLGLVQGAKVAAKVGRFAFTVLNFANPVFNLFLVVDIIDAIVNWLRRDEIANAREWRRLSQYFFGSPKTIRSVYGVEYTTSIQLAVNSILEYQLGDDGHDRNFIYWLDKWLAGTWPGFVYTQVVVEELERQEENSDAEYAVKYYWGSGAKISFTDTPQPNTRRDTFVAYVGPQDERNYSTLGGPAVYDPKYTIDVNISHVNVRITHPVPTLTPFDFIIVRCRMLLAEIVTFISQYDENIFPGLSVADDVFGLDNQKVYWLEGYKFAAPVDTLKAHFCLKTLVYAIDRLSDHAVQDNDFKMRNDNFNEGWFRRLDILRELGAMQGRYERKRMLETVGLELLRLVKEGDDALNELSEVAFSIDHDLVRALKECKETNSREYNYQGKVPK
jgi:hypothetical protein